MSGCRCRITRSWSISPTIPRVGYGSPSSLGCCSGSAAESLITLSAWNVVAWWSVWSAPWTAAGLSYGSPPQGRAAIEQAAASHVMAGEAADVGRPQRRRKGGPGNSYRQASGARRPPSDAVANTEHQPQLPRRPPPVRGQIVLALVIANDPFQVVRRGSLGAYDRKRPAAARPTR